MCEGSLFGIWLICAAFITPADPLMFLEKYLLYTQTTQTILSFIDYYE